MLGPRVKWQMEWESGNSEVGHGRMGFPTFCHQIFGRSIILILYVSMAGMKSHGWKALRDKLAICSFTELGASKGRKLLLPERIQR